MFNWGCVIHYVRSISLISLVAFKKLGIGILILEIVLHGDHRIGLGYDS